MKKIILALSCCLSLYANDVQQDFSEAKNSNGLFIGVEGGYAFSYTYLDTVLEDRENGHRYDGIGWDQYADYGDGVFDYGVKVGWYFKNSDMRAYAEYKRNTKAKDNDGYSDFSAKVSKILLGYDAAVLKAGDFRFIVGAALGYANMKLYTNYMGNNHSGSYDGFDAGLKLGFIYDLNSHNELEFGLKASYTFYGEKTVGEDRIWDSHTNRYHNVDINIAPYQFNSGLYIGYNFKF